MTKSADDYSTRAAAFRRLAGEPCNAEQRAALLAIADQYDAVAGRLNGDVGGEEGGEEGAGA